jgi:extradiol dioxygenase family protein
VTHQLSPFHVGVPAYDLAEAWTFYRDVSGCTEGQTSSGNALEFKAFKNIGELLAS